jgi:hypothetical protein
MFERDGYITCEIFEANGLVPGNVLAYSISFTNKNMKVKKPIRATRYKSDNKRFLSPSLDLIILITTKLKKAPNITRIKEIKNSR